MMESCMGVKPPVTNPEVDTHSAFRKARVGSIPMSRHNAVMITVATETMTRVIRAMNWVVCTTLGTTCSLRPSDENSDAPPPRPKSPKDNATTIRPRPPRACIAKRNMLSA